MARAAAGTSAATDARRPSRARGSGRSRSQPAAAAASVAPSSATPTPDRRARRRCTDAAAARHERGDLLFFFLFLEACRRRTPEARVLTDPRVGLDVTCLLGTSRSTHPLGVRRRHAPKKIKKRRSALFAPELALQQQRHYGGDAVVAEALMDVERVDLPHEQLRRAGERREPVPLVRRGPSAANRSSPPPCRRPTAGGAYRTALPSRKVATRGGCVWNRPPRPSALAVGALRDVKKKRTCARAGTHRRTLPAHRSAGPLLFF